MADDMAQQPEMWITPGPPGDQPPPGGSRSPHGPGGGWGRWIAIVAGLVVLVGAFAAQRLLSGPTGNSADPSTGVSITPPPTPSRSETSSTATSMTSSSGDAGSLTDSTNAGSTAPRGGPDIVSTEQAPPTAPVTSTIEPADLGAAPFELVALLWNASLSSGATIVEYRADTGELVRTALPAIYSNGPMSFVVTATAAIVRPWDGVPGYVVVDGAPAAVADGLLADGGPVFPSAQSGRVWLIAPQATAGGPEVKLELVDAQGHTTGAIIKPPASLGIDGGWSLRPDGAGGVLADAVGGVYDLRPDETRLVTHGRVLATGPTGYIVYECGDRGSCAAAALDRATGKRTPLPRFTPPASAATGQFTGVIAPDGRYAAMVDPAAGGPPLSIIDMRTGERTPILLPIDIRFAGGASSVVAFTPDSRVLAVMSGEYVRWVDPSTGDVLGELHLGPLVAIAIRPAP